MYQQQGCRDPCSCVLMLVPLGEVDGWCGLEAYWRDGSGISQDSFAGPSSLEIVINHLTVVAFITAMYMKGVAQLFNHLVNQN